MTNKPKQNRNRKQKMLKTHIKTSIKKNQKKKLNRFVL